MATITVYSAITGDKDAPRSDVWCLSGYSKFENPVMNAKIYKVLPHLFMKADYSVWIDGNIKLKVKPEELVAKMTKDIAVFPNPYRDCIYQEGMYCAVANKDDPATIMHQLETYRREGYPEHAGLAACGIIVRRHTPEILTLCEKWWAQICRYSARDQISFPYVFRDKVQYFEKLDPTFKDNKYFIRHGHTR